MLTNNSSAWKTLKLISFQQIRKYCTFYGKNATDVRKYTCQDNEICCDRGNGCCPNQPTKYYESSYFWILFFGMFACYLLCWYCKKLEKKRQAVLRANESSSGNPPRILPYLRPLDPNNVDHLLQTLIINYRSHLNNQHGQTQNLNGTKVLNNVEPLPEYAEALKMPKPNVNLEDSSIASNESMRNHADDEAEIYIALDIEEQPIPSYEEAIKRI